MSNNPQEQILMNTNSVIDLTKSSSDLTLNTQLSPVPPVLSPNDGESSSQHAKNRRKKKPKKVTPTNYANTSGENFSSPATPVNPQLSALASNDTKFDSDGCETIDKIAMMVSNITQSAIPLMNYPQQLPSQSSANDVEDKLEELFSESKTDPIPPPVEEKLPETVEKSTTEAPKPKKPRRKKPADGAAKRQPKKTAGGETKGKGKGDKSKQAKGDDKKDKSAEPKKKVKENGKSKVKVDTAPFLQIQSDGSFSIVNQTANGDDDTEKTTSKPKKPANERHKHIRGLHVSTLSNKYDVHKRDLTWICVFCKLEPHKFKLGDLFGPYIVTKSSKEFQYSQEDPDNDIFRQGNANKFMPVVRPPIVTPSPKKKRKNSEKAPAQQSQPSELVPDIFNAMTKIDDDQFEIWFHEDCLVWAPGTHIIGSTVQGLEKAVWVSTRHQCSYCHKNGAMMACLQRGCKNKAHFVCARKTWKLCDDFKTFCELHST